MPRIRNWKHLTLYRPSKETRYEHIDSLFTGTVDWDLIATHLPDMLRVGVSIAAGQITPSTILRKLGTYSKENRLYQAFGELGVAVRTGFLPRYLGNAELRATIQAATNKSESFNDSVQWLAFGGGVIAENDRVEQRKVIKYNHLLANCLIFHNAWTMTRVLHQLQVDGVSVDAEAVAALSPSFGPTSIALGHISLTLAEYRRRSTTTSPSSPQPMPPLATWPQLQTTDHHLVWVSVAKWPQNAGIVAGPQLAAAPT